EEAFESDVRRINARFERQAAANRRVVGDRGLKEIADRMAMRMRLRRVHDIRGITADENQVKADRLRLAHDLERRDVERDLIRAVCGRADAGEEVQARL